MTPDKCDQIWCDKTIRETFALLFLQQGCPCRAEREHVGGVRRCYRARESPQPLAETSQTNRDRASSQGQLLALELLQLQQLLHQSSGHLECWGFVLTSSLSCAGPSCAAHQTQTVGTGGWGTPQCTRESLFLLCVCSRPGQHKGICSPFIPRAAPNAPASQNNRLTPLWAGTHWDQG